MKYCPECKVFIGGGESTCPLCGSQLEPTENSTQEEKLYPHFYIRSNRKSGFPFAAKVLAFVSIIAIIGCTFLDLVVNQRLSWSLYVTAGILAAWITIAWPILRDVNINYMLLADLCSISALTVLVDATCGWKRWSVTYVLPTLYIGISIAAVVLALVFHNYWREYILSLIVICILGLVPLMTLILGLSTFPAFCIAAVIFALILLAAVLFFSNEKLFSEWKRRMNI